MKNTYGFPAALVLLAALLFPAGTFAAASSFKDVSEDYWAKEEIDFLSERGIIHGYNDGTFGIHGSITRAEAAVMVMRTLGWGDLSNQPDPGYADIDPSHWAYYEIAAMHNTGNFAPEGDAYQPQQKLTRAEMADILVNTFDLSSHSGTRFTDVPRDHWAYDAIQILAGNRITTGYSDGTFRPEHPVTRSEFAVFTARALHESFRPDIDESMEGVQRIYDVDIGGEVYQLEHPLYLKNTWLAPAELFEIMGHQVETLSSNKVFLTTSNGLQFSLEAGQKEVWIGGTKVALKQGVAEINGQPYIEASPILKTLEKPLVYYPDQRVIRIEAPGIRVADIQAKAPEAILELIHKELPYWQWTKQDSDYLELMKRNGSVDENKLREEMAALTEAFFEIEQEKNVINGLNYYSDHVTGKIDAVTRGLEARYLLLYKPDEYAYPAIGKSGATGSWAFVDTTQFMYTVSDHSFEHFADHKQTLIELIQSADLNFEPFRGLNIYGIPFGIREVYPDGTSAVFAGKAMGDDQMIVTNSNASTFIHEFGHTWDSVFGNHEEYLALRGKSGYTPASNAWEDRIEENFAEDFTAAFLPASYPRIHKGAFGEPSEQWVEAFRTWVKQKEQERGPVETYLYTLNGSSLAPKVIAVTDGKLKIQGEADRNVIGELMNTADGSVEWIEIPAGGAFSHTVELPAKGVYHLFFGKFNTIVVYL